MKGGKPRPWYLNPYVQLAISAFFITAAEVLLKLGAVTSTSDLIVVGPLASPATWGGIMLLIGAFLSWLHVLRLIPLTQAYALINLVHVLVPAAAWLFLQETVSLTRWCGIALVLFGTVMVAAPAAKAEEEL